jgi:tetratricopeptide (TPR) repeat protein
VAAALCAGVLVGTVVNGSPEQASVAAVRVETWRKAVEHHEPGKPDEPARTVAQWSKSDLLETIDSIHRAAPPNFVLARGAALHLDVAMMFRTAAQGPLFPTRSPDKYSAVEASDGQRRRVVASPTHLQFARALLEEIQPEPRRYEAARRWYRATAAYLAREHNLAEAVMHLYRARELFPGDTEILLASGCLHEILASPPIQLVVRSSIDSGLLLSVGSVRQNLQTAERYFRDAIRANARNAEARLRLGRVVALQGRRAEAIQHLHRVLKEDADPTRAYYASMFLGREEELRGRTADARQHFERATRLFPKAQSPHLALSRLAFHDGDTRRAERAVAQVFAQSANERERYDPWWNYDSGTGRLTETYLARLYEEVRRDVR